MKEQIVKTHPQAILAKELLFAMLTNPAGLIVDQEAAFNLAEAFMAEGEKRGYIIIVDIPSEPAKE